jgi:transposase-like protein
MSSSNRYAPEVRERAVRLVFEHRDEYESEWAAIRSIAEKFGCSSETLRNWVRKAERDTGLRPGAVAESAWQRSGDGGPLESVDRARSPRYRRRPGFRCVAIRVWVEPLLLPEDHLGRADPTGAMMDDWQQATDRQLGPWHRLE